MAENNKIKVFWSWQSDTDEDTGRFFIRDLLKKIVKDGDLISLIDRYIALDHDTKNVGGSPQIADTILDKINDCSVFIADLTPVGKTTSGHKYLQNPNVMLELGYALKVLGSEQVITIINMHYVKESEKVENALPFDLRHRRWPITFKLQPNAEKTEFNEVKEKLKKKITDLLGPSLLSAQNKKMEEQKTPYFELSLMKSKDEILDMPVVVSQTVSELFTNEPPIEDVTKKKSMFSNSLGFLDRPPKVPTRVLSLSEIKTKYPKLSINDNKEGLGINISILPELEQSHVSYKHRWSREQKEIYNDKLDSFYLHYEKYLQTLADNQKHRQRSIHVQIKIKNTGKIPANDVRLFLTYPDSVEVFLEKDFQISDPQRPEPPKYCIDHIEQVTAFGSSPSLEPLFANLNKSVRIDSRSKQITLNCGKIPQGLHTLSECFVFSFKSTETIGNICMPFLVVCDEIEGRQTESITLYAELEN